MFVSENEKQKIAVMAIVALLVLVACSALFSDYSSAEEEEEEAAVTEVDIDDSTKGFQVGNVLYVVTNETEYEEEAGIVGVADSTQPAVAVTSFAFGEEDEEITYAVTSVVADFVNHCATTGVTFCLSETVATLEADCFKDITFADTVYYAQGCVGVSGTGILSAIAEVDDGVAFSIDFDKGEVNYPQDKYKNQEMESQDVLIGMTMAISGCEFENPYYSMTAWTDADGNEYGDGASLTVVGGVLYIDGVASDLAIGDLALTANWEADGTPDYPDWMHWATLGIIIVLAIIGIFNLVYRNIMARKG